MTNSLSASFMKYWSKRMQRKHYRVDVFRKFVTFEEAANLKKGDTVSRPYRSTLVGQDYVRGTAFTVQDLTDTEETLVVQTAKIVPFYVDDLDALQSNYKTANSYADDAAVVLSNLIDGDALAEVANSTNTVDDSDITGGTAGNGITLSTAVIDKIFTTAGLKLDEADVSAEDRFAQISPRFHQVLLERLAGKDSVLGDQTGTNGMVGKYMNFQLLKSNASYWTGKLLIGTLPTTTDTVVINTVTFTFVTGTPTAAGDVKAVTDAATSITNLVASINAPGTSVSGTFVAVSAANQIKMKNIAATAVSGGLTLAVKGKNFIRVSETLTAAADIWTTTLQIQHMLFGKKGCVEMIIQQAPKLEVKDVQDKLGKNFAPWTLYGKKTFSEGAVEMVDVKINSSSW